VLCAVHHRAFDAGLFSFEPETTQIHFMPNGPCAAELRITMPCLSHLPKLPHKEALKWCWVRWTDERKEYVR
jgi:hypothetical protein